MSRYHGAVPSPFLRVLLLQLALFVAGPLLSSARVGAVLADAGVCLMLAFAYQASDCRPATKRVAWAVAFVLFAAYAGAAWGRVDTAGLVATLLSVVFVAGAGIVVLRTVLRSTRVDRAEVYGAVCFYLMLGIWWATAYAFFDRLDLQPAAFSRDLISAGEPYPAGGGAFGELLYFSYVTLTTVGYGDLVPTHPITRNLAVFEAITGQLYIAILLARLVSLRTGNNPQR